MVNKREEERRKDGKGNEERKGKEGKATQPSCDERNPWGDRRKTGGDRKGVAGGGRRGKLVATEGGKKRSRKKRLRI